ncbi:alpha/beta hydrolase [Clostridium fungisolvens]|uniref:Acetyl esterase n=1 Tax=Clostridium fungisolvens TaxID=1604897 RepID=A0A6V8SBX2_9CLOT|nr:alpha/beta hydrolase [Clostridium fungisolvens]GFP74739.1 Acetyl esterase [Clostridium fungisolvens]
MSLTSAVLSLLFKKGDALRDKGLTPPKNIERHVNINYYGDTTEDHLLDLYNPLDNEKPLPVIISIHGGGWVYGNKDAYQFYCMNLASYGFNVINFSYRLAPKYKFPAALEDVNAVFHWVKENSEKFNFDLNNLFVVGDSAGAQLAGQYAAITTNCEYANLFNFKTPDIRIKAMGLNCGIYDPLDRIKNRENILINRFIKSLVRDYVGKDIYEYERQMDFQSNLTSSFPPVFISCSVNDLLVGCKPELINRLKTLGIAHIYKEYGHKDKYANHVFHLNIRNTEAIKLNDEQVDFFSQLCDYNNQI